MKGSVSGIILCGGLNSRMHGRNKGRLPLGERTFLDHLLDTLRPFVAEMFLVTRDPSLYAPQPGVSVVTDRYEVRSSLTGIQAGLFHCRTPFAFVAACDIPLLQKGMVELLLQECSDGVDVAVPIYKGYFEPLCAVYSRKCLPAVEDLLEQGRLKIINLFDRVRVKTVGEEQLLRADPELLSFVNINTKADYERVLSWHAKKQSRTSS
jgi:molybdopterin-guanine dinucleotide biosynthesis protein A